MLIRIRSGGVGDRGSPRYGTYGEVWVVEKRLTGSLTERLEVEKVKDEWLASEKRVGRSMRMLRRDVGAAPLRPPVPLWRSGRASPARALLSDN